MRALFAAVSSCTWKLNNRKLLKDTTFARAEN
ncbi:hypothetical protein P5673_015441 [Acropora cervicornis]|uniref:Uncharacterized protein n=1 Tax=Acropora cervicornis TaxID=6130 RepID=A0AAD9QHP5_ACRCE|nr:hypothetical protein P5673_015441 [Acropora cervicornis]